MAGITSWPDSAVAILREERARGSSFSVIENMLKAAGHPYSRNACIGKAARLGIDCAQKIINLRTPRPKPVKVDAHMNGALAYKVSRAIKAKQLHDEAPMLDLPADAPLPGCRHLSLMEIDDTTCKYPHGKGPSFTFCGLEPIGDFPYCAHHSRLAYSPPTGSTRRSKPDHPSMGQFA